MLLGHKITSKPTAARPRPNRAHLEWNGAAGHTHTLPLGGVVLGADLRVTILVTLDGFLTTNTLLALIENSSPGSAYLIY